MTYIPPLPRASTLVVMVMPPATASVHASGDGNVNPMDLGLMCHLF